MPPFPYVRESLEKLSGKADVICCSATPTEALVREWQEHDIDQFPRVIAGQEMGTKAEHLKYATEGKYATDHVLMIGDAPGDIKAARPSRPCSTRSIPATRPIAGSGSSKRPSTSSSAANMQAPMKPN